MKYKVQDKSYPNLFELAKDFYKDTEAFASYYRSDEFSELLKVTDDKKYEQVRNLLNLMLPEDIFTFKVSYVLNPYMSFRIKGFCFSDYKKLGETILAYGPEYDSTLMEVIRYQLLSEQMKACSYDEENPDIFNSVIEIEKDGEKDSLLSYFCLGYLLSKADYIIYRQVKYKNIFNLVYYLIKSEKDLNSLGNNLSHSPLLKAYGLFHPKEKLDDYFHLIESLEKNKKNLDSFLNRREKQNSL